MPQLHHYPSFSPVLASAFPIALLWLGCSDGAADDKPAGPGGGSIAAAGSGGTAGKPGNSAGGRTRTDTGGTGSASAASDPAWFADCDIGEIQGSCIAFDGSDDYCTEIPAKSSLGELDALSACGAERVRSEPRCPTEGAVAVCVSRYSRAIYYDRTLAEAAKSACVHYCSDGGKTPEGGDCDAFLTCLCGSAEPQDDDSDGCVDARTYVAGRRETFGKVVADMDCAQLLAMTPTCKDGKAP